MRRSAGLLLSFVGLLSPLSQAGQERASKPDIDHPMYACGSPNIPKDAPCAGPPRPVDTPNPEYSDEARRAKLQGNLALEIVVDETGNVARAKVTRPLGKGLDEKALEAVRRWKFKPATYNGEPVPVHVQAEVTFRLR